MTRYVSKEDNGQYAIRIEKANGNYAYAATCIGIFSSIIYFKTEQDAINYLEVTTRKNKKKELPQVSKDFIYKNRLSTPDKKGYLFDVETGGRIKLTGLSLDYYNEVKLT